MGIFGSAVSHGIYGTELIPSPVSNLALKDNTGATAYSDIVTVQASGDRTCLTAGSSNISSPPNTGVSSPANTATGVSSSPASGGR